MKLKGKLLFIISSLVVFSLFISTLLWVFSTNRILQKEIISKQQNIAQAAGQGIDELLRAKLTNIILNSQSTSVLEQDLEAIEYQFHLMILQDKDLLEVSFIDRNGKELVRVSREKVFSDEELRDRTRDPVFVVPMFRFATEYIGSAYFTEEEIPAVTFAVPAIPPPTGTPALEKIRTIRPEVEPGMVRGIIVAEVSLVNLMRAVEDIEIEGGSVFINEHEEFRILAHTEEKYVGESFSNVDILQKLEKDINETKQHLGHLPKNYPATTEGKNELGIPALSTHLHLPIYGWGITVQQPIAIAFSELQDVYLFAGILFLVILIITITIATWAANKLIQPIHILRRGTDIIGKGNYEHRVEINTHDELQQLAESFNEMVEKLKNSKVLLEESKKILEIKVKARTKELAEINERLESQVEKRTRELKKKIEEYKKINKLTVGRELRMVELKKQLKEKKKNEIEKLRREEEKEN